MKKFELLGRSLSKEEQKKVGGGYVPPDGCSYSYTGCNSYNGVTTCDYSVVCNGETRPPLCGYQCVNGDEWHCQV